MAFSKAAQLSAFLIITSCFTCLLAADPDPMQDICVADLSQKLSVNGYPCKNATLTTVDDYVFSDLRKSANTSNSVNAGVLFGTVKEWPALNTLGISIARLDLAKGGLIPPHTHPFASELVYIEEGRIYAGFVTADNKLFAKVINKGEVMIVPRALIHWQLNVGNSSAKIMVTLNSQLPGFQLIANSMFGSGIADEVLRKTFFVDEKAVRDIKAIFS